MTMEDAVQIEAVERMKSHIEAHLQAPVTAADLAAAAGYSQFHAARIFRAATGMSPFEYLRERRLLASALALRGGPAKVIDVAFDHMFSSHAGFTRSFTRTFGISPRRFRRQRPDGWVIQYRALARGSTATPPLELAPSTIEETTVTTHNMTSPDTAVIFTQFVERPARSLLLRRSAAADDYFAYCDEFGCSDDGNSVPWTVLAGIDDALYEPVGVWLPENLRPEGTGVYAHGVEVSTDWSGEVPEGFELIDLEPCTLLVFQGEPYDDAHFAEAIAAVWERIDRFDPEVYGYEYAPEVAPRMQLAPQGWRGYIEMRPVRALTQA